MIKTKLKHFNKRERRLRLVSWKPHFIPFAYLSNKSDKFKTLVKGRKFVDAAKDLLWRVNEGRQLKNKHLMPKNRRVKSYGIYKLMKKGNSFFKVFKRVKLELFKEHYGINKTNRVVGWTPDYVGPTKSRYVKKKNHIPNFIDTNFNEIKNKCSDSFMTSLFRSSSSHRVNYTSGFDTSHAHLKEYFKDDSDNEFLKLDNILEIMNYSDFKWFWGTKQSFSDSRELFTTVRTNPNAFSGHYTSKMFGNDKRKSEYESRDVALKIWEYLKLKPLKNNYLWTLLGREKDIKVNQPDGEVGTRVILATENPATVLLMWFAQKINLGLYSCKYEHKVFNVIGEHNGEKNNDLLLKSKGYKYKLEADWTFFDSNIDSVFLKIAGIIITIGLPIDRLHKNISYYITKSLITKNVVLAPGIVIELNRAQASGHPFTTTCNCIVNTIYWCLIGFKIYGKDYADNMRIEVYGDDTYAYFKDHPNLFNIDRFVKECGLKSDSLTDNFRLIEMDYETHEDIDFLKRVIKQDRVVWNHKKMFDKLLYPSKNRDINDQILLLKSYYDTCKLDEDVFNLCSIIFNYVNLHKQKYSKELTYEVKDILADAKWSEDFSYSNVDDKFFLFYKENTLINNYNFYLNIYKWNVRRYVYEQLYNARDYEYSHKRANLLMLIAFDRDEIKKSDFTEIVEGIRPPPGTFNEILEARFDGFYDRITVECVNFVKRKVRQ